MKTNADLHEVLETLSEALNLPAPCQYGVNGSLVIQRAYGRPRLEQYCNGGTIDISPRLSSGQLYEYMCAMTQGANMKKEAK